MELETIKCLVEAGVLVVCAGGGGVPVVAQRSGGGFRGIEAVIDKDLVCSGVLAFLSLETYRAPS